MHKYRRRVLLLLVALGTFAACDGEAATPTTATRTTATPTTAAPTVAPPTVAVTTATTAAPPTTAAPTTSAPAGVPDNESLTQILDALMLRADALIIDPANADVSSVCAPQSDCETTSQSMVDNLVANGEHVINSVPEKVASIDAVRDLSELNDNLKPGDVIEVSFTVEDAGKSLGQIVDADGNVVYDVVRGEALDDNRRSLVRFPEDEGLPWRFAD